MRRRPTPAAIWVAATALVSATLLICLALGIRTAQRHPWWFWKLHDKHCLGAASLCAALVGIGLVGLARRTPRSARELAVTIAAAFGLAAGLQYGLALAEGRGASGLRDRVLESGHREFAVTATMGLQAREVFTHYEDLMRYRGQTFARSKPPGQLLTYMAAAKLADTVMPVLWDPERPATVEPSLWRLANFAVLVFPLVSCLVLWPLAYLGHVFLPLERAHWPALVYVVVPPTALVTLHMDQVLYPLLAASLWALAVYAARLPGRAAWAWWVAAGITAWLALFISFSLLPAVPLAVVLAWAAAPERRTLRRAVAALAGFAVLALVTRWQFDYQMIRAYARAMTNHRAGKHWHDAFRMGAGFATLLEFAYWIGVPVAALVVTAGVAAFRRWLRGRAPRDAAVVCVPLAILVTAFAGTTMAEVARLWIFFVPPWRSSQRAWSPGAPPGMRPGGAGHSRPCSRCSSCGRSRSRTGRTFDAGRRQRRCEDFGPRCASRCPSGLHRSGQHDDLGAAYGSRAPRLQPIDAGGKTRRRRPVHGMGTCLEAAFEHRGDATTAWIEERHRHLFARRRFEPESQRAVLHWARDRQPRPRSRHGDIGRRRQLAIRDDHLGFRTVRGAVRRAASIS
jgi:hypothetical protein